MNVSCFDCPGGKNVIVQWTQMTLSLLITLNRMKKADIFRAVQYLFNNRKMMRMILLMLMTLMFAMAMTMVMLTMAMTVVMMMTKALVMTLTMTKMTMMMILTMMKKIMMTITMTEELKFFSHCCIG